MKAFESFLNKLHIFTVISLAECLFKKPILHVSFLIFSLRNFKFSQKRLESSMICLRTTNINEFIMFG